MASEDGQSLPLVTAVIPTWRRPEMVVRAVRCALDQTFINMEVLVVVDGPHAPTEQALAGICDARLRVIVNAANVGLAEVKNIAARHARGAWIALLDDDDEWLPDKIEKQVEAAMKLGGGEVMVFSRFLDKTSELTRAQPYTFPQGSERFSEYLFCERGNLQSSTWFVSTALMRRIPFVRGLRIEDIDWLLRATADGGVKIGWVGETLSIYHNEASRARITTRGDWEVLYRWGMENRRYFTAKAFSYFLLTFCVRRARQNGAGLGTYWMLMVTALRLGSVRPRTVLYLLGYLVFSDARRRGIKDLIVRIWG